MGNDRLNAKQTTVKHNSTFIIFKDTACVFVMRNLVLYQCRLDFPEYHIVHIFLACGNKWLIFYVRVVELLSAFPSPQ